MYELAAGIPAQDNLAEGLAPPDNTSFDIEAPGFEPSCLKPGI